MSPEDLTFLLYTKAKSIRIAVKDNLIYLDGPTLAELEPYLDHQANQRSIYLIRMKSPQQALDVLRGLTEMVFREPNEGRLIRLDLS